MYAPDYVANAGGVINVYGEVAGWDAEQGLKKADEIYDTMLGVFEIAKSDHIPSYEAADRLAEEIQDAWLAFARGPRPLVIAGATTLAIFALGLLAAAVSIPWLRYVFPAEPGPVYRGMPTAHSAPPLNALIRSTETYVWPSAEGTARGESIVPLYPSVPDAALTHYDENTHAWNRAHATTWGG